MKHEYRIFKGTNYHNDRSAYWEECEDKRIANIVAIQKRIYAYVEWDYKTMDKYLQINGNWDNCTCQDDLIKLREDYMKTVDLPKKQQFYSIQQNVGAFYIKSEDIDKIVPQICKIFDNVIESNCLDIVPIEEVKFSKAMLR